MERKKLVIATVTSIVILLTIFSPILITRATDPSSYYTTVNGVLDSDYYILYPYAQKSLKVGFSKYGELIGIAAGADQNVQTNWVGLEYDGRDPFTPATTISMNDWINGWYLDVQYICPVMSGALKDRHLWAYAMFADGFGWGGNWTWAKLPGDEPHVGRKTNGTCLTDALKILYNGPRRFIAQSVTHVNDTQGATTWPVLDVLITLIFNKDTKEIILLKDLKLTIEKMKLTDYVDVQFSNREEYDLGPATGYSSFAHFYAQNGTTCYGPDWHMTDDLLRENVTHLTGDGSTKTFSIPTGSYDLASGFMKIWTNDVFKYTGYSVNWGQKTVTFTVAPANGADIEFHYKYIFKTDAEVDDRVPTWNHEYDIAQVISSDRKYVAWTAMWPPVSDYTVDGIARYLEPLVMVNEADMSVEPKRSPLVIGEWDFLMEPDLAPQFRCVEVKGVTDWHDADDKNATATHYWNGVANVIDREAQYQLDEIFQPWDLNDAVEKQEYRWLYKDTIGEETSEVQLTSGLGDHLYYAVMSSEYQSLGATSPTWTGCFLRDGGTYPAESVWVNEFEDSIDAHSKNWALILNGTGDYEMLKVTPTYLRNDTPSSTAPLTLQLKDLVDFGFWYKFISGTQGPHIQIKVYSDPRGGESYNWANIMAENTNTQKSTTDWTHYTLNTIENFIDGHTSDTAFCLTGNSAGLPNDTFHSFEYWTSKLGNYYVGSVGIQVNAGNVAYVDDLSVAYLQRPSGIRYERVYNMEEDKVIPCEWDAYCNFGERVMVDGTLIARENYQSLDPVPAGTGVHRPYYTINFINGTLKFYTWSSQLGRYITWDLYGHEVKVLYSTIEENEKGRYEWTVLGRDAQTSDSLGATLVTAAFKNKDIEIGNAGMDMMYQDWGLSCIPYVMNCFGTAPGARADYKDDGSTPGQRTALKDDWCTTWPITSSNMITVGGPLANVFTLYLNDFTDAFWGINCSIYGETFTPYSTWQDKVVALTCWNGTKRAYGASLDTGYAVIATYKDINGTVGLSIWGIGPRDTFYASKFFHEEIIYELQDFPHCVTSIILKIDYTDPSHPTFTIVECLGTISETTVETIKGGIHDP